MRSCLVLDGFQALWELFWLHENESVILLLSLELTGGLNGWTVLKIIHAF